MQQTILDTRQYLRPSCALVFYRMTFGIVLLNGNLVSLNLFEEKTLVELTYSLNYSACWQVRPAVFTSTHATTGTC